MTAAAAGNGRVTCAPADGLHGTKVDGVGVGVVFRMVEEIAAVNGRGDETGDEEKAGALRRGVGKPDECPSDDCCPLSGVGDWAGDAATMEVVMEVAGAVTAGAAPVTVEANEGEELRCIKKPPVGGVDTAAT